uniref:Secreted protein n=1 Tax=Eutreptiella gymnastica TaxID=73025 RepID=A0A7S4GPH2_9EUGL
MRKIDAFLWLVLSLLPLLSQSWSSVSVEVLPHRPHVSRSAEWRGVRAFFAAATPPFMTHMRCLQCAVSVGGSWAEAEAREDRWFCSAGQQACHGGCVFPPEVTGFAVGVSWTRTNVLPHWPLGLLVRLQKQQKR